MLEGRGVEALVREGFPGQRMLVMPRPRVREALGRPLTAQLLVTDCGYFPEAHRHGRSRAQPIAQAVVLICVKGEGWCETPDGRFGVRAGDLVFIPSRTVHAYGADEINPWTLWWLHLDGQSIPSFAAMADATSAHPVRVPSDTYRAGVLASEVLQWMEHDLTEASLVAAAGAAWHLLALLATSHSPRALSVEFVERAASAMRQDVRARTSVAALAATAGMSTSYFADLFKRRFGTSVTHYQTQLRMARARELLDTTARSIVDVALESGYEDSFYFARQFKKVHGVTPSEYRRQQKG